MRGRVARHALNGPRCVDERLYALVRVIHLLELRRDTQRLVERDVKRRGHQLCNHIGLCIRKVQRTAHVADRAARGHGAERHNLRHMVLAVFLADVVHNLAAARVAEIHIDIWHRHALGVQKALKIQPVLHGVDVGDVERIRHHGAGRAAASGAYGDAGALCKAHEVGDDKKIIGKAHLLDHRDLVFQLIAVVGVFTAIAFGKALVTELF